MQKLPHIFLTALAIVTQVFKPLGWWLTIRHVFYRAMLHTQGPPRLPSDKESTSSAGDTGDSASIPGSGRSPGGGHGNPLQHSCLENPMDRGAWRATGHRVAESDTTAATEQAHSPRTYTMETNDFRRQLPILTVGNAFWYLLLDCILILFHFF